MLRVWFGDRDGAIYNTSMYFNNRYSGKWLLEDFSKKIIRDVDQSEVLDENTISSPVLGNIHPEDLSGGVKTVILMKHFPGIYFNGSNCGNNCAKWILELGREQDCKMTLFHSMDFGDGTFDIRIMNNKRGLIAHNMSDMLDASARYLHPHGKRVYEENTID